VEVSKKFDYSQNNWKILHSFILPLSESQVEFELGVFRTDGVVEVRGLTNSRRPLPQNLDLN